MAAACFDEFLHFMLAKQPVPCVCRMRVRGSGAWGIPGACGSLCTQWYARAIAAAAIVLGRLCQVVLGRLLPRCYMRLLVCAADWPRISREPALLQGASIAAPRRHCTHVNKTFRPVCS